MQELSHIKDLTRTVCCKSYSHIFVLEKRTETSFTRPNASHLGKDFGIDSSMRSRGGPGDFSFSGDVRRGRHDPIQMDVANSSFDPSNPFASVGVSKKALGGAGSQRLSNKNMMMDSNNSFMGGSAVSNKRDR